MADPLSPNGSDALEETLGRLSKKAGVQATIVLDRASGSILKTSGQITWVRPARVTAPVAQTPTSATFANETNTAQGNEQQGAEELAALVWAFVKTAGSLVEEIDTEDELKLLRLRTRKQELVIVPDAKYLLIVIHETPPA